MTSASGTASNSVRDQEVHLATSDARFARIMVATDFSEPAAVALKEAIAIGEIFGSEIILVHAVSPLIYSTGESPVMPEMMDAALESAEELMKRLVASQPRLNGLQCRTIVSYAGAIDLMQQVVDEEKVNLIVVGSHGASGIDRVLLGSVAETILSSAICPVLITGPHCHADSHPLRSILFATDLETTGLRAAQYASSLAERVNGRLTLLHVMDKSRMIPNIQSEVFEKNCKDKLHALLPADAELFCAPKFRLEYGSPAQTISAVAQVEAASLIVLGLHHRSALADHAPWSTLSHVIRAAKCGVLAVQNHIA